MSDISSNNKRIAKNTMMLYIRMFATMLIGLFTSRVVLNALGASDFGLFNVVGGVVSSMAIFTALLSQGTSRFLTIAVGHNDEKEEKYTFSALITIHLLFALFVLFVGETVGLWFVNTYLNIDPNRMGTANFIYQLSLFSFMIGVIQTPYNSAIIAHEKMNIFAYISIWDTVAKLLIVYLLVVVNTDKLKLYSILVFSIGIITTLIYRIYCICHFRECKFKIRYDKQLYKNIFSYTGWNVIGTVAFTMNGQGLTILLNIFFGTIVNAARGIASTVSNMVYQFVTNFQMAVNPQIVKYYANNEIDKMNHLIIVNSMFASFLISIFAMPLFFEMDFVLKLWLGNVPQYTSVFARLTLIQMLIQSMDIPIGMGIHALGKMRLPNLSSSLIYALILPLIYLALKLDASPVVAYLVSICVYPMAFVLDVWILRKYSAFPVRMFLAKAPLIVLIIISLSAIIPYICTIYINNSVLRFFVVCIVCTLC